MVDDLIDKRVLIGKSVSEVEHIVGRPDSLNTEQGLNERNSSEKEPLITFTYELFAQEGPIDGSFESRLIVLFNESEVCVNAFTTP